MSQVSLQCAECVKFILGRMCQSDKWINSYLTNNCPNCQCGTEQSQTVQQGSLWILIAAVYAGLSTVRQDSLWILIAAVYAGLSTVRQDSLWILIATVYAGLSTVRQDALWILALAVVNIILCGGFHAPYTNFHSFMNFTVPMTSLVSLLCLESATGKDHSCFLCGHFFVADFAVRWK